MINIISKSIYQLHPSGPKKLIDNFISGLKKAGIPYSINNNPLYSRYNLIHDDLEAITYIDKHYQLAQKNNCKYMLGPNICFEPKNLIDANVSMSSKLLQDSRWIVPSDWVSDFWKKRGYTQGIYIWPVGVDTEFFNPTNFSNFKKNTHAVLYTKGRSEKDISEVKGFLKENNISFSELSYGYYDTNDFISCAMQADFGIILSSSESQGLALEELLSLNLPVVVSDIKYHNQNSYTENASSDPARDTATAIPYFDERCGYSSYDIQVFKELILKMLAEDKNKFSPREYVLENLSLKTQSEKIYQSLVGENQTADKDRSSTLRHFPWRNKTWYFPYLISKYVIKFLNWKIRRLSIKKQK